MKTRPITGQESDSIRYIRHWLSKAEAIADENGERRLFRVFVDEAQQEMTTLQTLLNQHQD
jgi:hypothetical protein